MLFRFDGIDMTEFQDQSGAAFGCRPSEADVGLFLRRMQDVRRGQDRLVVAIEDLSAADPPVVPAVAGTTDRTSRKRVRHRDHGAGMTSRNYFTAAAREAGRAVRRAKALQRQDIAAPQVFVVRRTSFPDPFAWEIRQFGGMILDRSAVGFPSIPLARAAGGEALAQMPP